MFLCSKNHNLLQDVHCERITTRRTHGTKFLRTPGVSSKHSDQGIWQHEPSSKIDEFNLTNYSSTYMRFKNSLSLNSQIKGIPQPRYLPYKYRIF